MATYFFPAHAGHFHVKHDQIESMLTFKLLKGIFSIDSLFGLPSITLQHVNQQHAIKLNIINYKNALFHSTGKVKKKEDPSPNLDFNPIVPPMSITNSLASDNPNPVPACSDVRKLSAW